VAAAVVREVAAAVVREVAAAAAREGRVNKEDVVCLCSCGARKSSERLL
jgi:hypothetical protein